ncbi:MAG: N-acetyltransferase [Gammaproteobacteria bacterium]|nr:N-acetyltransferase [Gammaproteobacteria bacterium]NIR84043.1 N-acetyltransferase [Gammaproteobacteria bacterium]NIR89187.1 N-acetyltransferase [Gammaproteobacteria bacterium]NIU04989.1 N-acetyltransferase [Gammaproteobacteria bacterium]NIV52155.1 GNAT family N-acetyltransferase [Gammaproteobacteria bacterium]
MELRVETMSARDWPAVRAIYWEGIDTGDATFEAAPPDSCEQWCASHVPRCTLVARQGARVCGWVALTPVSGRCVYGGVAELSIYVASEYRRRGVGRALLDAVIAASEGEGIWSLQAGVFPENAASLRLLERRGFRVVGRRERLGRMSYGRHAGRWRDVILLERRSSRVGTQ